MPNTGSKNKNAKRASDNGGSSVESNILEDIKDIKNSEPDTEEKKYKCRNCGKEYKSEHWYNKHKKKCKGPGGRPTKLNKKFIEVTKEVVEEGINAIIYTDKELREEINYRLPEKNRITRRTFENWKRKINEGKEKELGKYGSEFFRIYKKALRKQKRSLFESFQDNEERQWQKWAWIIERKFDDWNLRHKTEHSGEVNTPQPIINVHTDDSDTED